MCMDLHLLIPVGIGYRIASIDITGRLCSVRATPRLISTLMPWRISQLLDYSVQRLRDDGEFIL
jgi:hypothetical protein